MEDLREWSNETTRQFIDCYQSEPVIWDPKHKDNKDRKRVNDAWKRISKTMDCTPVPLLKKKKEALMATFRSHLRRKKASIMAGAEGNKIYTPTWQYYSALEEFLSPVYEFKSSLSSDRETPITTTHDYNSEAEMLSESDESQNNLAQYTFSTNRRRRNRMTTVFHDESRIPKDDPVAEDDCDIYGKLVAKRLKKLPERQKEYFMFKINELWWEIYSNTGDESQQVVNFISE